MVNFFGCVRLSRHFIKYIPSANCQSNGDGAVRNKAIQESIDVTREEVVALGQKNVG